MKNLQKISRSKLKSIQGGIEACVQNCLTPGYRKCCIKGKPYYCAPITEICL